MLFVIILAVLLAIAVLAVNNQYKKSVWNANRIKIFDKFIFIPESVDIVNIGSGPSLYDFSWKSTGINGYNLAVAPEDFRYDFRVLSQYHQHIKPGGMVIIAVCPLSFAENDHLSGINFSLRFANILPPDKVDVSRILYFLEKRFPIICHPKQLKFLIKHQVPLNIYDENDAICDVNGKKNLADGLVKWWIKDNRFLEDLKDERQARFYHRVFLKRTEELQKIVDYCIKMSFKPVIVVPPVSAYLREFISPKFAHEFLFKNLGKVNSWNSIVLNYYDDQRFESIEMFSNGLFLQKKARKTFTEVVLEDLKKAGCITPLISSGKRDDQLDTNEYAGSVLYNGIKVPDIGFGTGVVRRYTRNKVLYIRDLLGALKHKRLKDKLFTDYHMDEIVHMAAKNGYTLFDTGRIYGYSEISVGKGVADCDRKDLFIVTKVSDMDLERKHSPDDVKGNLDDSLKYLQTAYVDAYLLHWPHGNWVDIYHQIEDEYKAGRAKSIGVCNFKLSDFDQLMKCCEIKPMICQLELHPFNSKVKIREYCKENNILVMAHTPTGRMCDKVRKNPVLIELSRKYNKTLAQIIIRWHYQNGVVPVIATKSESHMKENRMIYDFELSGEDMAKIESLNEDYVLLPGNGIDNPQYIYNL